MEAIFAPDVSDSGRFWPRRWRFARPQHHISRSCERRERLECTAPGERFQPRSVSLRGVRRLILSHSRRTVSVAWCDPQVKHETLRMMGVHTRYEMTSVRWMDKTHTAISTGSCDAAAVPSHLLAPT